MFMESSDACNAQYLINIPSFGFDHKNIFQDFSLALHKRKWTSILGPSGIGKTTLLKLLAGLLPSKQNLSKRISYLSQNDSLLPWATILDNILIGYKLRGQKITQTEQSKALDLLDSVNLAGVANHIPSQLSGGMRQRVSLIRILMEETEFVLLDEPFSSLDRLTQRGVHLLTRSLLKDKTVLMVTHDPIEAIKLSDYIYIFKESPVKNFQELSLPNDLERDETNMEFINYYKQLLAELQL
jgi:putative hydroxymethylpyrimidine transport system ATP-binding protein